MKLKLNKEKHTVDQIIYCSTNRLPRKKMLHHLSLTNQSINQTNHKYQSYQKSRIFFLFITGFLIPNGNKICNTKVELVSQTACAILTNKWHTFLTTYFLAARRASGLKNRVVGSWHGYLSGVRYRLAYGPADATATHCLLLQ